MPIGAKAWPILADVLADSQKTNFFNTFSGTDTITASNRSTYVAKGQGKRAPSSVQVTHTTTAFARPHLTSESVTTAHHTTLREEQRRAHGPRLNSKHDCHDARQFCTTTQLCTDCEVGWGQGGTVPMSDPSLCQDDATATREALQQDDHITQVRNMIMLSGIQTTEVRHCDSYLAHVPASCSGTSPDQAM